MNASPRAEILEGLTTKVFDNAGAFLAHNAGDEVQLSVQENRKNPGRPIFIREDGKLGFPTINSVPIEIGDTIRGRIKIDTETVFFVEVNEVIARERK